MTVEAVPTVARRGRLWGAALVPVALLAGLLLLIVRNGPGDALRGSDVPAVEQLAFQRIVLDEGGIHADVLNDGPDPVTIAQVTVDDAFWSFQADRTTLAHLGRTTVTVPYPWVHGETHRVKIITSTGATFEHEIAVALPTPHASARVLGIFTLIGLYVGVLPVAIGLLWYPLVGRLGRRGLDFVLALTIGLLVFLLADAVDEGLDVARALPGLFQGFALFALVAGTAFLALEALSAWLRERRQAVAGGHAWTLALPVAIGIGLHNLGEGLAIGAAFALGEGALGTLLIVGFTLHNTTEGIAIVAPLARTKVRVLDLAQLGLIGGLPTIAGAWLGGLLYSPVIAVVFLAVGAGAIAQVVAQIARQLAGDGPVLTFFSTRAALAGLVCGFALMYSTGMLVG